MSRRQVLRDGWRRFREVVPDVRSPRFAALLWGGIASATAGTILLGTRVGRVLPGGAIGVECLLLLWAGGWMFMGFRRYRLAYRARYGALAYRQLCLRFLVPFWVGGGAAVYFPLFAEGAQLLPPVIAYGCAAYCLVTMQLIERRGIAIFWDLEWRASVYNVFPQRGRIVTGGIFRWLRHPVYSAAIRFALALALIRDTLPALVCATLVAGGVWTLGGAEERDLRDADAAYATYRRAVPAFFVSDIVGFWRFLIVGDPDT